MQLDKEDTTKMIIQGIEINECRLLEAIENKRTEFIDENGMLTKIKMAEIHKEHIWR